ncbi:MAG: hypothetical protein BWY36_00316 [Candidatus Diapherotrites archaeon ADurb.Bin253]|jgi:hypothetical protein|nr:MAG: hypothetical protein BWY36_00316 [Candidatus Diapherotrites archaeon ADurb.Bin253]HNZ52025.1 hypothetical protein [Candidatus Pacearchaeota archaeon]HOC96780.1 hypothetical protein [Candidatus Pacearchaeota archaeon]HOF44116.1 hypothetical protein [Candidatus Pacearchaeota archaeon]HOH04107.1 hypothetical protein [Candidatus Pacearchaeota archaeon]
MKQKDDYLLMIEDYECLNNNSKFECRFCNGFGKYLNKYIVESTAECYKSRIMGEGELKGLSKKIFEII